MSDRFDETSDETLGRRLAGELPRYTAPPRLRVTILDTATSRPRRPVWLTPLLSAAATAMVLALAVIPVLPRIVPADPAERYVRAVVSEHSRALMWGSRHGEVEPAGLTWVTEQSGIALNQIFLGDERLEFVAAEPVYLERQRGVAIHYRDTDGHMLTYVALPGAGLVVPDPARVQIGKWRPALLRDNGFAAWVWKQKDVACFLVSDMVSSDDVETFKEYFTRVRASTEPVPAY
jgi:anti-sigma factor RsiW